MKIVVISFILCLYLSLAYAQIPGGLGPTQKATPEVQGYADELRADIESQAGVNAFKKIEVIAYRSQVVAGTNFFMKIKVGCNEYIHARIFRSLTGSVSLSSIQVNKSLNDLIEYF